MVKHFVPVFLFTLHLSLASAQDTAPVQANPQPRNSQTSLRNEREQSDSLARSNRLKRLPRMYGDSLQSSKFSFSFSSDDESESGGSVQVPSGTMARIADNNSPLPQHRVYFVYQHFHNALVSGEFDDIRTQSLDLYTIGVEKTFYDDLFSVEFRLPFTSSVAINSDNASLDYDTVQSITTILKALLWYDDDTMVSCGLGISFPLSDEAVSISSFGSTGQIVGQSPRFSPFLGFGKIFSDTTFMSSFIQLSLPSSSEYVQATNGLGTSREAFDPHTLFVASISGGAWLMRSSSGPLTGIAAMAELHYTTVLGDDQFAFASTTVLGDDQFAFASTSGSSVNMSFQRFDTLNLTTGLHFELSKLNVRFAVVSPLREDRFFDTEIHVSVNREF